MWCTAILFRDSHLLEHPRVGVRAAKLAARTRTPREVWRGQGPSRPPQWDDYLGASPLF